MAAKSTHTPLRNIRVPDDLWEAAKVRAAAEGITISAFINACLQHYVELPNERSESA